MAKQILLIGETAAGKTSSLRFLPPEETYIIDADLKGLNWKGWRKQYSVENKNYTTLETVEQVKTYIKGIVERLPNVKYIVIDTITNLMISDEIYAMKQKGYDKWIDLTQNIFDLITYTSKIPQDITFIYVGLSENENNKIRLKTNGKKLGKIELEAKFNVVILIDNASHGYNYILKKSGTTARCPIDFLEQVARVENEALITEPNILTIIHELEEY